MARIASREGVMSDHSSYFSPILNTVKGMQCDESRKIKRYDEKG